MITEIVIISVLCSLIMSCQRPSPRSCLRTPMGRILDCIHLRNVWTYRSLFQRYGLDGGHEMAAFLQDEERALLCIATDQVEDHIDLLSQNLLKLSLSI